MSATAERTERDKLASRAGIVGAGTLLSRVLGLGRDMALAAIFTRPETDAFFVAFTIPNALRQLLGEGAISSAVVPVMSAKREKDGAEATRAFFAKLRGASLLALVVVTALGMLFAQPLTDLFAAGYRERPADFARTVGLTRAVFPYIFFMGTAALGMAALHAERRFAVASFAPGLLNVAFLFAAFALPGPLVAAGLDRSYAMVAGALLGGLLQVVAQWPSLRRIGYGARPRLDFSDPDVREVLRRITPMTFGIGVYYVDLVLSRRFLSELGAGAQSYFSWAMRLCDFPLGIFVMALSTAALPSLASLAAAGKKEELVDTFAYGLRLTLFVALPASALFVALGEPLVATLFQRGEFDALAAHETGRALLWQGGTLWTVALVRQLVAMLHALGDTRAPVIVSALDLAVFIALAASLKGPFGHVGISIAVGGSSTVQMLLLFVAVRRRLGTTAVERIAGSAARTIAASVAAAVAGFAVVGLARAALSGVGESSAAGRMLRHGLPGLAGGAAFALAFVIAAWLVRSEELRVLGGGLARRLRRARPAGK